MADFWMVKYTCGFIREYREDPLEVDYEIEYYHTKHEALRALNVIRRWQKQKRIDNPKVSDGYCYAAVYPCSFSNANPEKLFEKFGFRG